MRVSDGRFQMTPRVAVVIPVFNRADLLLRCLQSLEAQTVDRSDFEVIVVDDGSTYSPSAAIEALKQSSNLPVQLIGQSHAGPAAARNTGIACASAPIIAFTDSDTTVGTTWLAELLETLGSRAELIGVEGATIAVGEEQSVMRDVLSNRTGGLYLTCNVAYRTIGLRAVGGFDSRFQQAWAEDSDLAYRMLRLGPIAFNPNMLCTHPVRPTGALDLLALPRKTVPGSMLLSSLYPEARRTHSVFNRTYAAYVLAISAIVLLVAYHDARESLVFAIIACLLYLRIVRQTLRFRRPIAAQWLRNAVACAALPFLHYLACAAAYPHMRHLVKLPVSQPSPSPSPMSPAERGDARPTDV